MFGNTIVPARHEIGNRERFGFPHTRHESEGEGEAKGRCAESVLAAQFSQRSKLVCPSMNSMLPYKR